MNIKRNSYHVLGLVMGVSVILYIFNAPIIPTSTQLVPTISIPTAIPAGEQIITGVVAPTSTQSTQKQLTETITYGVKQYIETLMVTARFNGTTITDLQVSHGPTDGTSGEYQSAFESEIKPMVVGKKISDINVSSVAGASYTTAAFMEVINRMQSKI